MTTKVFKGQTFCFASDSFSMKRNDLVTLAEKHGGDFGRSPPYLFHSHPHRHLHFFFVFEDGFEMKLGESFVVILLLQERELLSE